MSLSMRAVQETWFESTACFMDSDQAVSALTTLAVLAYVNYTREEYGSHISLWFEKGNSFLNYIGTDHPATVISDLGQNGTALAVPAADLNSLVNSLRSRVPAWRQALGMDGELVIHVDAY